MHFNIPHQTTQAAAVQKVKQALIDVRPHMKDQAVINKDEWQGNTLYFDVLVQGKNITGTVQITDTEFVIDAKLPLMWRIFEGAIERELAKQVQALKP